MTVDISYLPAELADKAEIEIKTPYSISGNNVDGFIITEWRNTYGG
jgi:hypothetical protein